MHQGLTRREFLRLSTGAGVGLAVGGPMMLGGCGGLPAVAPIIPANPSTNRARVAAVRGADLYEMTRQALDAIGGLHTVVKPGETVFIKPNLLTAGLGRENMSITGETTKPEIVIAVAEECLRVGAAEVIVGDGSQVESFDWEEVVTLDGSTHMAAEAARLNAEYEGEVTLVCLNTGSPEWDPVPSPRTNLGNLYVSSLVARSDRVISIPVLKTHRTTRLSLSLKNFVGVTPISRYGGLGQEAGRYKLHRAAGGIGGCLLDVVAALRPDLAIIDASIGCEGTAPWVRPNEGRTVDLRDRLGDWLVLASTDPVAADATAARIIGHDPAEVDHINLAYEQGLGQARADLINIEGATLDELRVDWDAAELLSELQ